VNHPFFVLFDQEATDVHFPHVTRLTAHPSEELDGFDVVKKHTVFLGLTTPSDSRTKPMRLKSRPHCSIESLLTDAVA
jgi:hypothetical protein